MPQAAQRAEVDLDLRLFFFSCTSILVYRSNFELFAVSVRRFVRWCCCSAGFLPLRVSRARDASAPLSQSLKLPKSPCVFRLLTRNDSLVLLQAPSFYAPL